MEYLRLFNDELLNFRGSRMCVDVAQDPTGSCIG